MPRHQKPMKDVAICDKPRGADKQALNRGCPNGETQHGEAMLHRTEYIGCMWEPREPKHLSTLRKRKRTVLFICLPPFTEINI